MYPGAICKASDKIVENSARIKKMSHLIKLKNNSCMCGNYQVIKVSLFSFVLFNDMLFQ